MPPVSGAVIVLVDCLLYWRVFLYIAKQHPFRFAVVFQSDLALLNALVALPSRLVISKGLMNYG